MFEEFSLLHWSVYWGYVREAVWLNKLVHNVVNCLKITPTPTLLPHFQGFWSKMTSFWVFSFFVTKFNPSLVANFPITAFTIKYTIKMIIKFITVAMHWTIHQTYWIKTIQCSKSVMNWKINHEKSKKETQSPTSGEATSGWLGLFFSFLSGWWQFITLLLHWIDNPICLKNSPFSTGLYIEDLGKGQYD